MPVAIFFVGHKFPPGEKSSLTRPFLPPGDKIVCNADALAGTFSPGEKLCKIRRVKYPRQIKSNSLGNFSLGGISSWESACYTGWGKIPLLNEPQLPDRILTIGKSFGAAQV